MNRFKTSLIQIKKVISLTNKLSKNFLLLIFFICLLQAVTPFVTIVGSSMLIDGFIQKAPMLELLIISGAAIIINIVIVLILGVLNKKREIEQNIAIDNKLSILLSQKLLDMDYEHIENPDTHRLKEGINMDKMTFGGIHQAIYIIEIIVRSTIAVIISIFVLFNMFFAKQGSIIPGLEEFGWINSEWMMVGLVLFILFAVIFTSRFSAMSAKKEYQAVDTMVDGNRLFFSFLSIIQQYTSGKDIRIYNAKDMIGQEIDAMFGEFGREAFTKISKIEGVDFAVSGAASAIMGGLTYIFVGLKAWLGIFPIGSVVRYAGAIHEFIGNFSTLIGRMTDLISMSNRMQKIFDFLDLPDIKYHGTLTVEKRADNEYELEFHNVSFKYPSSDKFVLKNLNLKLNIGQRMAVVGMNGSGKTTMIKLLTRLYDPTEGSITLNGIDIRKYDYSEYMGIFSVVFQDFKLFSFSLGQNIATSVEVDEKLAVSSLVDLGMGKRFAAFKRGLDTPLYNDFEEDGVEISGGEAQRIALARAIYKKAPFIVLDEPTAALDPLTEFDIYLKFNEFVGDKTVIYISHRLSSCRFCDDIAVFDKGELVQRGNHDTLVKDEDGKYYSLWNAQAQYYK